MPRDGVLRYDEGVFIGYRAWERAGTAPAYPFGHGLGYTDWAYEDASFAPAEGGPAGDGGPDVLGTLTVRLRNTGDRPGREVVQVYLAAPAGEDPAVGRPARVLAGFLSVELAAGAVTQARIALARRAAQIWDPSEGDWRTLAGTYTAEVARSVADRRLTVPVAVNG
ncbi:fibronectin type III-like domain-contianing protein [Actinacidiphila glaucinigra]|uniref:fibronectin type III-like domain-contianing protein n=1 Tax=Actinacidiphila glaucinigra TaxID=235986 RepID=UPI002E35C000|nr:fibronectin type III-like domain-contianing protein [Actinacidiphila glaucinigra]